MIMPNRGGHDATEVFGYSSCSYSPFFIALGAKGLDTVNICWLNICCSCCTGPHPYKNKNACDQPYHCFECSRPYREVTARKWWAQCSEFEFRWNLAIFQTIVEWLKKPTCCYSTLSSTTSALGTSGGGMNLYRRHLKNTACTTKEEYKLARNEYVRVRREKERRYEKDMVDKCKE